MNHSRTLCLIPARGGSRGIPRKNLVDVGGKPLIEHTIEVAAAAADRFDRVVVTTDDAEIADVSKRAGAEVPFMRPHDLASDTARSVDVVLHALREMEVGFSYDWVMLLQPTAPFRLTSDLDGALELATNDSDSVISVVEMEGSHPIFAKRIEDGWIRPYCEPEPDPLRRQDIPLAAYKRNGSIYLTARKAIEKGSLRGEWSRAFEMPPERSINIDSPLDLALARLLATGLQGGAPHLTGGAG